MMGTTGKDWTFTIASWQVRAYCLLAAVTVRVPSSDVVALESATR